MKTLVSKDALKRMLLCVSFLSALPTARGVEPMILIVPMFLVGCGGGSTPLPPPSTPPRTAAGPGAFGAQPLFHNISPYPLAPHTSRVGPTETLPTRGATSHLL